MFESGSSKLKTHCGVVLGLIMVSIIVIYGLVKGQIMINFMDNTIQEPTSRNYFEHDFTYDSRDGFRLAFALTAYDSSSDAREFDESFGTVGAYQKIWGEVDALGNNVPTYFKKLALEPCRTSDINLEGDVNEDKYRFYSPSKEFEADTKRFYHKLMCIKDEPELMGNYNSAAAKQIVIRFEICKE